MRGEESQGPDLTPLPQFPLPQRGRGGSPLERDTSGTPLGGGAGCDPPRGCPAGRGCWLGRGAVQGGREGDLPVPGAVPACRASRCPRPGCTSRGGARPLRAPGPSCPLCSSPGTPRGTPAPRHCNPFSSGLGVPVGPEGAQRPPLRTQHPPLRPPKPPPENAGHEAGTPSVLPPPGDAQHREVPDRDTAVQGGSRCLFSSAAGAGGGPEGVLRLFCSICAPPRRHRPPSPTAGAPGPQGLTGGRGGLGAPLGLDINNAAGRDGRRTGRVGGEASPGPPGAAQAMPARPGSPPLAAAGTPSRD